MFQVKRRLPEEHATDVLSRLGPQLIIFVRKTFEVPRLRDPTHDQSRRTVFQAILMQVEVNQALVWRCTHSGQDLFVNRQS